MIPSAGRIQTVEDIYQVLWTAVQNKQPISAIYENRPRLLCPHQLGRNYRGELRVLCYQFGGDSRTGLQPSESADNWRCIMVEKLRQVRLVDGEWRTAPNRSRPAPCVSDLDIDADDPNAG